MWFEAGVRKHFDSCALSLDIRFFVDTITKYRNEHLFMRFFHTAQPQPESLRLRF